MNETAPWLEKWSITKDLSHGGQGTTKLVVEAAATLVPETGVLKILKEQNSQEARRRMYREVTNLVALHNAGCRVPKILDSNVDRFEIQGLPLYFVMEYVSGETLSDYLKRNGPLNLKEASEIVLSLCETVRAAQREDILHRDLKPENIVISRRDSLTVAETTDVVIVDYGLSFNKRHQDTLTRASETLDNAFLSLPERRIPGGNRRDPRSDITGLSGILYFCLTGHAPVDLVGPDNRPPHRRPGHSIREKIGEGVTTQLLETFFDTGFSANIESRFQSPEVFSARLREVLDPALQTPSEDPIIVAQRASEVLRLQDRKTQLADFRGRSGTFEPRMMQHLEKYSRQGSLGLFKFHGVSLEERWLQIEGYDEMNLRFQIGIRETNHETMIHIAYQIRSQASECIIFRALRILGSGRNDVLKPWQAIYRYRGDTTPEFSAIFKDFDAMLGEAIRELQRLILSGSN